MTNLAPKTRSITFGLDFDGTITATDPFLWQIFIKTLRGLGHKVYIVTMRYPSEEGEISKWRGLVDGVVFTSRQAKEARVKELGLDINIWIDDNPKAVHMGAKEIWGSVSPEGVVHSPTHDREKDALDFAELMRK